MSENKDRVDKSSSWSKALEKFWKKGPIILWAGMLAITMAGSVSEVVAAREEVKDMPTSVAQVVFDKMIRKPEEGIIAQDKADTLLETVLLHAVEKNIALENAGFDSRLPLFKNAVLAEALKNSGVEFTHENLEAIARVLGQRSANVLVEESVGGFPKLQCLELVSWLGRIGAIDPRLVVPGGNVREVADLLDKFRGPSGNYTEFLGYDDRKVIIAKDVMDPRLWKSEVSVLYGLKSKYDRIGHAMIVIKLPNSDEIAVVQSNASMKEGNIWEIGSGENVTVTIFPTIDEFNALTRQLSILYVLPSEQ